MFGLNNKKKFETKPEETSYGSKKDFVKIDDRYYFFDKISELSINELDEAIARASAGIKSCNEQVTRIMEIYGPVVTDFKQKDKIVRINHAMIKMKRGLVEFSVERKKKMRDLKFDEQSFFRAAARELLDEKTYNEITLRAKAIFELKKDEKHEQKAD